MTVVRKKLLDFGGDLNSLVGFGSLSVIFCY